MYEESNTIEVQPLLIITYTCNRTHQNKKQPMEILLEKWVASSKNEEFHLNTIILNDE